MLNPKILFICVNYNSFAETKTLVEDLSQQSKKSVLDVFVVNNAPQDDSKLEALKALPISLEIIKPETNLGYFGAAHRAVEVYLKNYSLPEFVIVSNPDIRIQDPEFIANILSLSNAAVFATTITSLLSGLNHNPHMLERPTSLRMHTYKYIFSNYLTSTVYHLLSIGRAQIKNRLKKVTTNLGAQDIYSAHGAFLIFHRSYFEAGGHLQHGVFLYGEEIFVAETCRKLGLSIRFVPTLRISHSEHVATRLIPDKKISGFIAESARYCAEKFF